MSDITSYGDMVVCGQYDRRTDGHHRHNLSSALAGDDITFYEDHAFK